MKNYEKRINHLIPFKYYTPFFYNVGANQRLIGDWENNGTPLKEA